MKTSEIASHIEGRNPKLHIGGTVAFQPLPPGAMGGRAMVGWIAFNLIRCLEGELQFPPMPGTSPRKLWFQYPTCSFALMKAEHVPLPATNWEEVEFDGYGGLETWKELSR